MKMPWQRKDNADLEQMLVAARAVPRDKLVSDLIERIGPGMPERVVGVRHGGRRLAFAGVTLASMVVLLAAFGGAGYATSSGSQAAHSFYKAVVQHHDNEGSPRSTYSAAWYHENPHPGYFCGTKGSEHQLKLILTEQRYDRLIQRGWKLDGGPFRTEAEARHSYPDTVWKKDDGVD